MTEKKKNGRKPDPRAPKILDGVIKGKSLKQAAVDAGINADWAGTGFYRGATAEWVREQYAKVLEGRRKRAMQKSGVHTDQIVGHLVEIMEASPADVMPENKVLQAARQRGVDHLIKKITVTPMRVGTTRKTAKDGKITESPVIKDKVELEMYSRLDAISQLRDNFGMKQEPRANTYEETKRQEVEKAITAIMEADKVDRTEAAKRLLAAIGDDSPLIPQISKYVH